MKEIEIRLSTGNARKDPMSVDIIAAFKARGHSFRWNAALHAVEVDGELLDDELAANFRTYARDVGFRSMPQVEDAWRANARTNQYHPIKEYLEKTRWDGNNHIGHLASFIRDKRGLFPFFFLRWLIGAVARVYERTQNRMLVLSGDQDLGKSWFVRWLAGPLVGDYFIEAPIVPEDKDCLIRALTKWIWEVGELDSTTRKADRSALKNFLSMEHISVRRPYGRYDVVGDTMANYIGTVNDVGGFLSDPTGSRRFMTLSVEVIDWSYTEKVNIDQVWAQAKALYGTGEPWHLLPNEKEHANAANTEHEVEDPIADQIDHMFIHTGDAKDFVWTCEIIDFLNTRKYALNSARATAMAIAEAARKLWGYANTNQRKKDGSRMRGYAGVARRINLQYFSEPNRG